jgi:aminoglycoside N3'-acetyltransferase
MLLEKIAKLLLPSSFYRKVKVTYGKIRRKYHIKLSEQELFNILTNDLKIKKGSLVFIHSSIDKLFLDFEPENLLKILIDIVGVEGTIIFPCNQLKERAEDYLKRNEVFDTKRTMTKMGLLPGLAMFHKDSVRSVHPTNSVVAIGKLAKELTDEHQYSIYPCGEKSPYYKIINYNGIIVGLGVSTESLTFVHVVEDIMKEKFPVQTRMKMVFDAKVKDKEGKEFIVKTLAAHTNTGFRDVPGFIKKHIPPDICLDFKIKGISFFRADATRLFEKMMKLAENRVTIYSKKILI